MIQKPTARRPLGLLWGMVLLILFACNMPTLSFADDAVNATLTAEALDLELAQTQTALMDVAEPEITETATPVEEDTPTATPTATPITHNITPSEPGWIARWFLDTDSSVTASQNRAPGGDDFSKNLFERPFTHTEMKYRPDVDIIKAEISGDSTFFYVLIHLKGLNPETNDLPGVYGVELDLDRDGRGDYLIWVEKPSTSAWSIDGVTASADPNNDVGSSRPMRADTPGSGNGYEQVLFSLENLQDPDAAWARLAPGSSSQVQVAFKRSQVGNPATFLWSVWADTGVMNPSQFDYNDHFTLAEAGSPYRDSNYPLKALFALDNTCRETFGFTATGNEPGVCYVPPPPTPTVTRTTEGRASVSGKVFVDNNNNGVLDAGEPGWNTGVTVAIGGGTCAAPDGSGTGMPVAANGNFGYAPLTPGNYCVSITTVYPLTTPDKVNISLAPGGSAYVVFGLYAIP